MPDTSNVFEKPSVERLMTGGTYILIFTLLGGVMGWLFVAVASQEAIGVGGDLLGFLTTTTALNIIGISISGGFHQSLSKYISEAMVESKEKAIRYAKAGFIVFNIIGIILFGIFITIALIIFPNNWPYAYVFVAIALTYFLDFNRDNWVGNLAGIHRFDYIGISAFLGTVVTTLVSFLILFLVPNDFNAYLLPFTVTLLVGSQLIFTLFYSRKKLPYPISSVVRGARRSEISQVFKYGLFCIIPNIIFSAAILWIQNLWYSGFFSFGTILVSANGLILGYSGIALSICNFGWPQIPAVSEAKAQKDFKLIDDYMRNTLHNGFNITALFVIIYIGLSHPILLLFHGEGYLIAHIPFIILTAAVAILGVEFLICTLLIGLGEGKKAATLIISIVSIQIICVPLGILLLSPLGDSQTLYAGPIVLLITAIALFPMSFHYLKTHTSNPPKVYKNILLKGAVSIILALVCYVGLDFIFFPLFDIIIAFLLRAIVLFLLFTVFMLIFAGLKDSDLDSYEKMVGRAKLLIRGFRWILHHSPFYNPKDEGNAKYTPENREE